MKRSFLKFPPQHISYLPKVRSSRMKFTLRDYSGTSYKSDGGGTEEEKEELLRTIRGLVKKELETRASKEESDKIAGQLTALLEGEDGKSPFPIIALRALADEKNGALAMLTAQGIEIQRIKTMIQEQPKDLSVRSQVVAYFEANKDTIKKIKERSQNAINELKPFEIEFRAAADNPMLPSTVMAGGTAYITRFEVAPGIVRDLRADPTFWDFLRKGKTGSETYIWINKKPTDGGADWVGPGVFKPAVSFKLETEISNAKKIAVSEKMATELLQDVDGFTTWVEEELSYALFIEANNQLQGNAAGSNTEPEGLQHMSVAYNVNVGVKTVNPNFWDVVIAGVTMLRTSRFRGQIVAFVNPVDYANAKMTKAVQQGQLFIAPATGATIVEDLNMTLGTIQFVAIDYYKILIYKAFQVRWGLDGTDFSHNLITAIAEMRLHQFHSENHDGFAVYDTIANIKNLITEA